MRINPLRNLGIMGILLKGDFRVTWKWLDYSKSIRIISTAESKGLVVQWDTAAGLLTPFEREDHKMNQWVIFRSTIRGPFVIAQLLWCSLFCFGWGCPLHPLGRDRLPVNIHIRYFCYQSFIYYKHGYRNYYISYVTLLSDTCSGEREVWRQRAGLAPSAVRV